MSDPDETDLLAGEYVLGTLDPAERAVVAATLTRDPRLADAVAAWQDRLGPLSEATPEIVPPAAIFEALRARLFGRGDRDTSAVVLQLRRRVGQWRTASAALATLAAGLAVWIGVQDLRRPAAPARFAAVLQRDAGAPAMVLDVDLATRRLTVRPLVGQSPAGKSYELWLIDAAVGPPRSLGLVPTATGTQASLAPFDPAVITDATYAVTLEPLGGSPNGQPTSAPILSGRLVRTAL